VLSRLSRRVGTLHEFIAFFVRSAAMNADRATAPAGKPIRHSMTSAAASAAARRLQELDRFWKIGNQSLKQHQLLPFKSSHDLAAPFGFGAEMLRRARAFARDYPRAEFDEMKAVCRRHGFGLGRSHVIRLMQAPAEHRGGFLRDMAQGHWSHNQAITELRKRFGYRRANVGRLRHRPDNLDSAMVDIHDVCRTWRGLYAALFPPKRNDDTSPKPSAIRLPPAVRRQLKQANKSMSKLAALAELKLQHARARATKSAHAARRRSSRPVEKG
jgi:hypothetical protein